MPTCAFPKVLSDFRHDAVFYITTESISCITSIVSTTPHSSTSEESESNTSCINSYSTYPVNQYKELQHMQTKSSLNEFMKIVCACLTSHVSLTWSLFGSAFIDWIQWYNEIHIYIYLYLNEKQNRMEQSDYERYYLHLMSLLVQNQTVSNKFSSQFILHTLKKYLLTPNIHQKIQSFYESVLDFMNDTMYSGAYGFCPLIYSDGNQDKYPFSLMKVIEKCWKMNDESRFGCVKNLSGVYENGFDLFIQEHGNEMGCIVEKCVGKLCTLLMQEYVQGVFEGLIDCSNDDTCNMQLIEMFYIAQIEELKMKCSVKE